MQKQIIKEIEAVEKEEKNADDDLAKIRKEIESVIKSFGNNAAIHKICSLSSDKVEPKKLEDETNNYIGLEHIESNTGRLVEDWKPTPTQNLKSTKNKFKTGNLLYGKLRPYLNKVYVAEFDGFCSTDILVLQTEYPKILKNILLSEDFVKRSSSLMKGINLPRLEVKQFFEFEIPFPEESKIKKIEKQFESLEAQINEAEIALSQIQEKKAEILKRYL